MSFVNRSALYNIVGSISVGLDKKSCEHLVLVCLLALYNQITYCFTKWKIVLTIKDRILGLHTPTPHDKSVPVAKASLFAQHLVSNKFSVACWHLRNITVVGESGNILKVEILHFSNYPFGPSTCLIIFICNIYKI